VAVKNPISEHSLVMNVEPILLDAIRAAELLAISERTLGYWTKQKFVPSILINGRRLYSLAMLREWAIAGCPQNMASQISVLSTECLCSETQADSANSPTNCDQT
jgi:hypothetical protein